MPNTLCVLCDIVKLRRRIASRKVSRVCVCVCHRANLSWKHIAWGL